jgi:hypothetical protein
MEDMQPRAQIPRRPLHVLLAGKEENSAQAKEEVMRIAFR